MNWIKCIALFLWWIPIANGYSQDLPCINDDKKADKLYDEAMQALNTQQYKSAIELLDRATDRNPDFAKAYHLKGHIFSHKRDYEQAAANFEEALAICTDYNEEVHLSLGMIYFQLAVYPKSVEHLKAYLKRAPADHPDAVMALDKILEAEFLHDVYQNPVPYEPKPLDGVCTKYDEYLPILSPDNEMLFFTRRYEKKTRDAVIGKMWVEEFCMSKKTNGSFGEGVALTHPFNLGQNEGGASISIDNRSLFITVCRAPDGYGSCDLYHSSNKDGTWTTLKNLGPLINDTMWQSQVSIASNGKTLYYASDRLGGYGGKDIYYSVLEEGGKWSAPINMGPVINSDADEKSPFIHADGKTLYFSSEGHLGLGGFDIFISRQDENGSWQKPSNIGYPINSSADDLGFFVSTDGKTGYFASDKLAGVGGWDIYYFPLYEGARPNRVLFVKGEIKDGQGNPVTGARLELKDLVTNEVQEVAVDSATGAFYLSELFRHDQMMTVHKRGYFFDSKLVKTEDEQFEAPVKMEFTIEKFDVGSTFTVDNILFDTDRYDIKEESLKALENLIRFMRYNDQVKIEIAGHTDDVGDESDNLELSHNRAHAVYEHLFRNGIPEERMEYKGYGETVPVAGNETISGRQLNRRTEVRIIGTL